MVNTQVLEGHWNEFAGQIKEHWGQLTDQDLSEVKGNAQQLVGMIQRKTGQAKETIEREIESLMAQGQTVAARASSAVRQAAEQTSERLQQGYEQVSDQVSAGYDRAERAVKQRPVESVALAFGTGLIAGVIVGLVLRSR